MATLPTTSRPAATPMRTSLAGPVGAGAGDRGSSGGPPPVGRSSPAGTRRPAGRPLPSPALAFVPPPHAVHGPRCPSDPPGDRLADLAVPTPLPADGGQRQ